MTKQWVYLMLLCMLLAACTPNTVPISTDNRADSASSEARATPTTANTAAALATVENSRDLDWVRDQNVILLQLMFTGGMAAPAWGKELPFWTLYGDGFVVWTETGDPTPGFAQQVWTGSLSEAETADLVAFATESGFLELDANYNAPQFSPVADDPNAMQSNPIGMPDQVTGIITLNLVSQQQQVAVYPASWEEAPAAYRSLKQRIQELRPADAALYVPQELRLTAVLQSPYNANRPPWLWPDLPLDQAAAASLALNIEQGMALNDFLMANGVLVNQEEQTYRLDLLADPPR